MRCKNKHKNDAGFTLIELLVVISIIGLLASVVLVSINSARSKARDAKRKTDLKQIQKALEIYYDKYNTYPTTTNNGNDWWSACNGWVGLKDTTGSNGWIPNLAPTYVSRLPLDPKRGSDTGALTGPTGGTDNSEYCYVYRSDGKDYKVAAHCASENGPINQGDPFYKGTGAWGCGNYHFGLYTAGAEGW